MSQTVIGIFDSAREAQDAVEQLISNGFSRSNIDISAHSADQYADTDRSTDRHDDDDSIGGFFRSLFGSDDETTKYSKVARRSSVVTVHAQSGAEAERASEILDQYGAVDVDDRLMQYDRDSNVGTVGLDAYTTTSRADLDRTGLDRTDLDRTDYDRKDVDSSKSIPVIEENLQVGKREVATSGGVRVRSRIIEKPVEENLRLRTEHVHVERNPVNRPASEADLANFQEGTIEVTERAEMPVVNKEARVVEEINVSKDVDERVETIRDTVRKTDVDIEKIAGDERRYGIDDERDLDADDERNRPAGL